MLPGLSSPDVSARSDGTTCCTAKVINPYYMMKGTEFGYFYRKNNNGIMV